MKVKIISIGDELLIGQVVDTNASWIAAALNEKGIQTIKKVTIPDDEDVMVKTLDSERQGADVLILTGGLGPTRDDKTKAVLTSYFNDHLVLHQPTLDRITQYFDSIRKVVTQDNHDQALVPSKCRVLKNEFGTAPGMLFEDAGQLIISLPGVPTEMKSIMSGEVLPLFDNRSNETLIESRSYITVNIPESILSERLHPFEDLLPQEMKLAFLPHLNIVRLRLNVETDSTKRNRELLDKYESRLIEFLGDDIIWYGDLRMEAIVGQLLQAADKTITVAESCTGGYVSHKLTSISGSSAYFPGSIVTYSYDVKTTQLQVSSEVLWEKGAVSEDVVRQMASSARLKFEADYGVAISGIAGPGGGTKEKPVGTVWMAVKGPDTLVTRLFHFRGDRPQVIERSAIAALNMVREMILNDHPRLMEKFRPSL